MTEDNVMSGVYFQDQEMRLMYDRFPEILFVDATYDLTYAPLYFSCGRWEWGE